MGHSTKIMTSSVGGMTMGGANMRAPCGYEFHGKSVEAAKMAQRLHKKKCEFCRDKKDRVEHHNVVVEMTK